MLQFNTTELRGALSMGGLKTLVPALAFAAGLDRRNAAPFASGRP